MILQDCCKRCSGEIRCGWNGHWYHIRPARHAPEPTLGTDEAARDWQGDEVLDFRERAHRPALRRIAAALFILVFVCRSLSYDGWGGR